MKLPILAATAFFAATTLHAQDNSVSETKKSLELKSISVNTGFDDSEGAYSTINDIATIAPGFMLRKDVSDYTHNSYNYGTNQKFSVQGNFEILGISEKFAKYNPVLKLGLQYNSMTPISHDYSKHTTTTIDTLFYQSSKASIPIDEKAHEHYSIKYVADVISVNAALLIQTSPEKRLSFFAGLEANLGKSIKAEVIENINAWSRTTDQSFYNDYSYVSFNANMEAHSLEAHDLYYASLQIPLGLSLRVGKDEADALYPLHINASINPGIAMASIRKFDSYSEAHLGAQLGITIDL